MNAHSLTTLTARKRVHVFAVAIVLATAPAVILGSGRQDPAPPATAAAQASPTAEAFAARLAATLAEMQAVQEQAVRATNDLERRNAIVDDLDQRLRDARLAGEDVPRDQLAKLETEYAAARDEARQATQQFHALNARVAELRRNAEQIEREQRTAELAQANTGRQEAARQADEALARAQGLAVRDDAATALRRAIAESQLRQMRVRYEGLSEQAERARLLVERGMSTPQEYTQARTAAEAALAELQEAALRMQLEEVQEERGEFAERNKPAAAAVEVTGQVLQTEFFRGYLDTVQRYSELSADPSNAAVAAVVTAADLLRDQGPQASIDYFEPILRELEEKRLTRAGRTNFRDVIPATAGETAVRLQLADAYHAAGRNADALRVLRSLIVTAELGGTEERATTRPE